MLPPMDAPTAGDWSDTPPLTRRAADALERIATFIRIAEWERATPEDLNPAQLRTLQLLQGRGAVRLAWIAERLGVSSASASDTVRVLAERGLVDKRRATDDGRALAVALSDDGRAVLARAADVLAPLAGALERLPAAERTALLQSLLAVIGALRRGGHLPEVRACPLCRHFERGAPGDDHFCALAGLPLPPSLLRTDCPEFAAAPA